MLAWTQSDIVMIEPRIMWSVRLLNSSDHDYDTSEAPGYLPIVFPRDNDSLALEEPGDPDPDQASSEALLKSLFLGLERSSTFLSFSSGPSIGLAVVLLILAILVRRRHALPHDGRQLGGPLALRAQPARDD